jgi:hypothetical protein
MYARPFRVWKTALLSECRGPVARHPPDGDMISVYGPTALIARPPTPA